MKKEMLINVLQQEECRIAIVENGVLEELYVERASHENYVGNIYKGRIVNIEPSIQAAFVDFGVGRNGFLHVSDVEPAYYKHIDPEAAAAEGRDPEGPRQGRSSHGGRDGRGGPRISGRGRDGGRRGNDADRRRQLYQELEQDLVDAGHGSATSEDIGPGENESSQDREGVEASGRDDQNKPRRRRGRTGRGRRGILDQSTQDPAIEPQGSSQPSENIEQQSRPRDSDSTGSGGDSPLMGSSEHRTAPPEDDDELLVFNRRRQDLAPATVTAKEASTSPLDAPDSASIQTKIQKVVVTSPSPALEGDDTALVFRPHSQLSQSASSISEIAIPQEGAIVSKVSVSSIEAPVVPDGGDDMLVFERVQSRNEQPIPTVLTIEPRSPSRNPSNRGDRERFRSDRPSVDPLESDSDGSREEGSLSEGDERARPERERRGPSGDRRRRPGRDAGRSGDGERPKPPIQEIFKRGQEVIVQVIKEGIGTKGPTLSTYISIAGRYLVLMPGLNRVGVSRKIMDDDQRRRLRDIFEELKPPTGLGFIIRTAGVDKTRSELQRDLAYLSRLWQVVARRIKKVKSPAEVYQESDMITRTIRDTFTNDIDAIWVDERSAFEHAQEFLQFVMPKHAERIKFYDSKEPLYHKYGLEDEIARMNHKKVPLANGGSIVIEQTEALVAIDVNSGSFRTDGNNSEDTAYQMNLQAAKEIARQLRLRDLGGVIVNDFIDMREERHRRGVEKALKEALRRDRARTKMLRISAFGLIEMTRQRIRPSLKRSVFTDCANCKSLGYVKTSESMSLEVMRLIQLSTCNPSIRQVIVRVTEDVARYLLNRKRREIVRLEESGDFQVEIQSLPGTPPEALEVVCFDQNDHEVRLLPPVEQTLPSRGSRRF